MDETMMRAAKMIKEASKIVVLTGAGMSTEAGIPDFRSKEGWWNKTDPMTLATSEAVESNYDQFHAFYINRLELLQDVSPTKGHYIIADWEKEGRVCLIATQNVDGLHRAAGSDCVEELHGSITSFRCHHCEKPAEQRQFFERQKCTCGGDIRPNVVLFGEKLPQKAWNTTLQTVEEADLVLVIGTSLQVYPVNTLPSLTDGKLILINAEPTEQDTRFDAVIHGKAVATLQAINAFL